MDLQTLSVHDVLRIHSVLVKDFAESDDPISPSGVRSENLLNSAVSRQFTGIGERLKFPEALPNAATLLYGICCDHPFHNGNKRTALVSMLAHLDKNKLTLYETSQSDLYTLMIGVASHSLGVRRDKRQRKRPQKRQTADQEVGAIVEWLEPRVAPLTRGEEQVTYRRLRQILERFNYSLANQRQNRIEIVRRVVQKKGLIKRREFEDWKRIDSIGFPGENRIVPPPTIKRVRRLCRLTEEDGIDSAAFYGGADPIDAFVNHYRTVLRRLART
jgi:death-on-curing protein